MSVARQRGGVGRLLAELQELPRSDEVELAVVDREATTARGSARARGWACVEKASRRVAGDVVVERACGGSGAVA